MKREQSRDPRRLPNPEELRKTTEPFSGLPDSTSVEGAAISQKVAKSTTRHSEPPSISIARR
jgi:hypothetical protein